MIELRNILTEKDRDEAFAIIEASVRALCFVDHGRDEETIQLWLKSARPGLYAKHTIVAFIDQIMVGVASMDADGRVYLNYVDPAWVEQGVSKTLLDSLKDIATAEGLFRLELISTAVARQFYFKQGFVEIGTPQKGNGRTWNHRMMLELQNGARFGAVEMRGPGMDAWESNAA